METPGKKGELTFLEMILFLALDDKGWCGNSENSIKFGLAGAILFELILTERIELLEGKIRVLNSKSVDDPVVDKVLTLIKASKKERPLRNWIQRIVYKKLMLRKTLLKELMNKNVVRKEEYSLLWVFYQFKYPLVNSELKKKIQEDLHQKVMGDKKLSDYDLMLLAVMNTCKMIRKNFRHLENYSKVSHRIREITQFPEPLTKKIQAIKEIQSAITRAIIASNVSIHA
jgi:hypothetical protein